MKVSIITPVYNGERFIRKNIESIKSQQGDFELEHIICDGLSSDNTVKIAQEYDHCTVISQKDNGPADAINHGMSLATGDIAAWLNADDIYLPNTIAIVTDYFSKHKECQWLYGNCPIIDEDGKEIRKLITLYKEIIGFFYSRNVLLCENFINQPATFWRLNFWRKIGELNSNYKAAWDYELWLKMSKETPAAHIRKDLASFRRHESSISENFFEQQFTEELSIAKEHGSKLHALIHRFNVWKIIAAYKIMS